MTAISRERRAALVVVVSLNETTRQRVDRLLAEWQTKRRRAWAAR